MEKYFHARLEGYQKATEAKNLPIFDHTNPVANTIVASTVEAQKQPAMSLEEVKDEVAKQWGFNSWMELDSENGHRTLDQEAFNKCYDNVAELYANQFREEQKCITNGLLYNNAFYSDFDSIVQEYKDNNRDLPLNWRDNCIPYIFSKPIPKAP